MWHKYYHELTIICTQVIVLSVTANYGIVNEVKIKLLDTCTCKCLTRVYAMPVHYCNL